MHFGSVSVKSNKDLYIFLNIWINKLFQLKARITEL